MKEQPKRYYLKCDNCGFLTEVISENQTWCLNCTQQFPLFYKRWHVNNKRSLDDYKKEVCIAYSELDIKLIVNKNNIEKLIDSPTKEQRIRRTLIKEGRPLDRGGFYEWDWRQFRLYLLWLFIIFGTMFLLVYLLRK